MKDLGQYSIKGGTGDIIEQAYEGDIDDFNNFIEDIKSNMSGWVESSQEFTKAWHNGKFITLYTDTEQGLSDDEVEEDEYVIWFEEIDDENIIFGIYN